MGEYETLAIPGFIIAIFAIKYLIHRCYAQQEQRIQAERLRIIENILHGRRPNATGTRTRSSSRSDASPSPPPEFESALRSSIAVIYMEDEPPPTYEEYQKTQEEIRTGSVVSPSPPYVPNPNGDREDRPGFRCDGDVL